MDAHLHPDLLVLWSEIGVKIKQLAAKNDVTIRCYYLVGFIHSILGFDIGVVVGKAEEAVMVHQVVEDVTEFIRVVGAEETGADLVDHLLQLGIGVVIVERVVAPSLQIFHFVLLHAEDKDVVHAHFFSHFDIGSIQGADGQRTVQHKLHVARSGGLSSSGGNLLAQVGGRDDLFSQGDTIVLQEDDLKFVSNNWVTVDHLTDSTDELDDLLGHMIARCSLLRIMTQ